MKLSNDLVYGSLLLVSLGLGYFVRTVISVKYRKAFCAAIGFSLACIVAGVDIVHSIIVCLINSFIVLQISPK